MKKIMKKRGFKYLGAFLILVIILFSMTIQPMMAHGMGDEILIKTKPFDPRDLFRGDYVQLNYEINDISLDQLDQEIVNIKGEDSHNPYETLRGKKLYVLLKENDRFYEVDKVSLTKPTEGIFLKGKYGYPIWEDQSREKINPAAKIDGIRVEYTLDKYFVPENTGKELEEKARKGEVFAKIKVYKGYSLLMEIVQ